MTYKINVTPETKTKGFKDENYIKSKDTLIKNSLILKTIETCFKNSRNLGVKEKQIMIFGL